MSLPAGHDADFQVDWSEVEIAGRDREATLRTAIRRLAGVRAHLSRRIAVRCAACALR